jgi:hypothetical protein
MAFSAFDDRSREPRGEELDAVLLDAFERWLDLIARVKSEFEPLAEDWVFSGKKWGWALRLKHRKRAVLYMTPSNGFFYVGFALGEKAAAAAQQSDLPQSVLDIIDNSQRFAEGRGVRLEVRSGDDVADVLEIARIKMTS